MCSWRFSEHTWHRDKQSWRYSALMCSWRFSEHWHRDKQSWRCSSLRCSWRFSEHWPPTTHPGMPRRRHRAAAYIYIYIYAARQSVLMLVVVVVLHETIEAAPGVRAALNRRAWVLLPAEVMPAHVSSKRKAKP
jgi:hypothetical protein